MKSTLPLAMLLMALASSMELLIALTHADVSLLLEMAESTSVKFLRIRVSETTFAMIITTNMAKINCSMILRVLGKPVFII